MDFACLTFWREVVSCAPKLSKNNTENIEKIDKLLEAKKIDILKV